MTIPSRSLASVVVVLSLGRANAAVADERGADVLLEDMKKLVVMVEGTVGDSPRQGAGIIAGADADGLVVITADHVVREGDEPVGDLQVRFNWRPDKPVAATLLSERIPPSPSSSATGLRDLAVLRIAGAEDLGVDLDALPFERVEEVESLRRGDDVYFMGNPGGHHWWVNMTPGKFADRTGDVLTFESKHLAKGYSGGALLDEYRSVIGMLFEDDELVGRALDITRVVKRLREWRLPVRLGNSVLPASFETLSLGYSLTCGVAKGGFGYCWRGAAIDQGAAGGKEAKAAQPERIGGIKFRMVESGNYYTCGLTTSGQAYCFGDNSEGQLGNPEGGDFSVVPVPVAGGHVFRSISAGHTHVCGVTEVEATVCWGTMGATPQREPWVVSSDVAFDSTTSGRHFTCGLTKSGRAYCWGENSSGQLSAQGLKEFRWEPVAVHPELTFRQLSAGTFQACGVTTDDAAYCWGGNDYGERGDESGYGRIRGGQKFAQVTAGDEFSCGITTDGRAYCWGNDTHGALGDGSRPRQIKNGVLVEHTSRAPVQVATDIRFRAIFAGKAQYACGIARDGTVYCWGSIHQRLRETFGDYGQVPVRAAVTASAAR